MKELSKQEVDALPPEEQKKYLLELRDYMIGEAGKLSPAAEIRLRQARRHKLPYYQEPYALELLPIIDWIIETKKGRAFKFKDYRHWSPQTLYARLHQSWLFIQDNLDPTKKYREHSLYIEIQRPGKKNTANEIRIVWTGNISEKLIPCDIRDTSTYEEVMEAVKHHIENGPSNVKFIIPDEEFLPFELTHDERKNLDDFLRGISAVLMHHVSVSEIVIIKKGVS